MLFPMIKEKTMKRAWILTLILIFAAAGCGPKKEAPVKLAEGTPAFQLAKDMAPAVPALDPGKVTVVATCNRFDVTAGEVLQMFFDSMGRQAEGLKDQDAQRIKAVIERGAVQIGERKLLFAEAVKAKKTASPEEIQKAIEAQYARAGGENQYLELLKTNGMNLDYIKKSIAEDLAIRSYLEGALAASGKVSDAEVEKAYTEDKTATVRHILLLTQGKSATEKAEIRKKMEDILARARKGEDFAALAKEFSEDPGSKDNGGLYEDFARGAMVKPFDDAAFSVPVGEISDIVETSFGYHILKVENRKKETRPFDEVKEELASGIKQQRQNAGFEALLVGLKKKAGFKPVPII
jgi:parvulin-like peptidyl-prolyl isomerase